MNRIVCVVTMLIMFVVGCVNKAPYSRIEDILDEVLLESDPTVYLLDELSSSPPTSKKGIADYYLLETIVRDKQFIPHETDQEILKTIDYYSKRKNSYVLSVAYFYLGRVYEDLGQPGEALKAYINSSRYVDRDDYYWNGRIKLNLGNLYQENFDFDYAQNFFEEAVLCFAQCKDSLAMAYAYGSLGRNYLLTHNFEDALKAYEDSDSLYLKFNNTSGLLSNALSVSTLYLEGMGEPAFAELRLRKAHEDYNGGEIPLLHYPMISMIYVNNQDYDNAIQTLEDYIELYPDIDDETLSIIHYMISSFYQESGDYLQAYNYLLKFALAKEGIYEENLNTVLREVEKKYEKQELENEYRAYKIQTTYLIIIALLLIIISVVLFSYTMQKRKAMIISLETDLEALKSHIDDFDDMKNKLSELLDIEEAKENRLQEVLNNKMLHIQKLVDYLFLYENNSEEFKKKVRLGVVKAEQDEYFGELHEIVNKKYYGLVDYLKETYPSLSEDELNLCCLLCFGFNNNQISILFGHTNSNSVFNKRHKLRKKLGLWPNYESLEVFIADVLSSLEEKANNNTTSTTIKV